MADRYWRGGAGAWNASNTTNWSATSGGAGGASVPTAADNVFFNASSGAGAVTITGTTECNALNIDCTGFTGTWTQAANTRINCHGSLTLVTTMTFTPTANSAINMESNSSGNTFTLANKNGFLNFNGAGAWTMGANATATANVFNHNSGTLSFGGYAITFGTNSQFNSSGSATRTLDISNSTITMTAATSWNLNGATNLTLITTGSTIACSGGGLVFEGNGFVYNNFLATTVSATITIRGANKWNAFSASGSGIAAVVQFGNNQETNSLTLTGVSSANRLLVQSESKTAQINISTNTQTISNADFNGINNIGAAWDFSAVATVGDWGNNTNITFTPGLDLFWVPSGGTSTGTNNVATRWATSPGGTPGTGRIPLCHDRLFCDASSMDAAGCTITNSLSRILSWDWSGVTNTPAFARGTAAFSIRGDLIYADAMTHSGSATVQFVGDVNSNFRPGSGSLGNHPITVNKASSTVTVSSVFNSSSMTLTSGLFDCSGYDATLSSQTLAAGGSAKFKKLVSASNIAFNISSGAGSYIEIDSDSSVTQVVYNTGALGTLILNDCILTQSGNIAWTNGAQVKLNNSKIVAPNGIVEGLGSGGSGGGSTYSRGRVVNA